MLFVQWFIVILAFLIWLESIIRREIPHGILEWIVTLLAIIVLVSLIV